MTRGEALSVLNAGETQIRMTAGIAIRGQIRRAALMYGVDYYEEKGWIESVFVFRGPVKKVISLKNALVAAFGDD